MSEITCGSKTLDKYGKCNYCGFQLDVAQAQLTLSKKEFKLMGLEV